MTVNQFKRFVDAVNAFREAEERLSIALESFNDSWTTITFCTQITESIYSYIKEYFNDEEEWFDYWYFELDQGKTWTEQSCHRKDGTLIKLETIEDIYNLLKENKDDTSI